MAIPYRSLPASMADFPGQDWSSIDPFFKELEDAHLDQDSLEAWLAQYSALIRITDEFFVLLAIAKDQDTSDKVKEGAYLDHSKGVRPLVSAAADRLTKKLLDSGLELAGMEVSWRIFREASELFRDSNLPLIAREAELASEQRKIDGAQTAVYNGVEMTLQRLIALQSSTDRLEREQSYLAYHERRLQDVPVIDRIFDDLVTARIQMAENSACSSYADFRFRQTHRNYQDPDECRALCEAIEASVLPLRRRILEHRRKKLGLELLKPWDLLVDLYAPVLLPFKDAVGLAGACQSIFNDLDPEFGDMFKRMWDKKLMDLESRKHKAPGAYLQGLSYRKGSFVFMSAGGSVSDLQTLVHESGHAFHNYLKYENLPYSFQWSGGAFNEMAAIAMEYLTLPHLGSCLGPRECAQVALSRLESVVLSMPFSAAIHLFEQWVYEHPKAPHAQRHAVYLDLQRRFLLGVDWSGLDEQGIRGTIWQKTPHIFKWPFYHLQYATARAGALQIWKNSLEDAKSALGQYKKALSLGSTRSIPELFKAAGADFDFSEAKLGELMKFCEDRIDFYQAIVGKT